MRMSGSIRYFQEIWSYRFFWLYLVRADLRMRYRRSVVGILWSVLNPLAMTAIVYMVYQRLLDADPRDFIPYLLTGLAFWNWMSASIMQGCASIFQAEPYLRQEPVPSAVFPLRVTLSVGFHFLILLTVTIAISWILQGIGGFLALLSIVPILLILFILGWSLATLAGYLNVYFPDTQHLCEVGLQLLFYSTPIIYTASVLKGSLAGDILQYNPVLVLVDLLRAPVFAAQVPTLAQYGFAALITALPALLAVLVVARYERRLVYQM